jgi:hypothetical protein
MYMDGSDRMTAGSEPSAADPPGYEVHAPTARNARKPTRECRICNSSEKGSKVRD